MIFLSGRIVKINYEKKGKYCKYITLDYFFLLKYAQNSPPTEISRLSKKGKQFFRWLRSRDGGKGEIQVRTSFLSFSYSFRVDTRALRLSGKINRALLSIEVPGRFAAAIKRAVYVLCSSVRSR